MVTNIKDKSSKFARERGGERPIEKQFLADKQGTGVARESFNYSFPKPSGVVRKGKAERLFLSPIRGKG